MLRGFTRLPQARIFNDFGYSSNSWHEEENRIYLFDYINNYKYIQGQYISGIFFSALKETPRCSFYRGGFTPFSKTHVEEKSVRKNSKKPLLCLTCLVCTSSRSSARLFVCIARIILHCADLVCLMPDLKNTGSPKAIVRPLNSCILCFC